MPTCSTCNPRVQVQRQHAADATDAFAPTSLQSSARDTRSRNLVRKRCLKGAQSLLQALALLQALRRYNTFVFLYDTSFLRQRELPLLKLLRKRIVYVFCGSDDRPTYLDGGIMAPAGASRLMIASPTFRAKKRMLREESNGTPTSSSPDRPALLHERPFVSFPAIGIPRVLHDEPAETIPPARRKIVHAPTHPAAKGKAVIRATLKRLRARGYDFEYVELQGVPNGVVCGHLQSCAFVIDQVWSDTAMDGFVADAALYGRLRSCPGMRGMKYNGCCPHTRSLRASAVLPKGSRQRSCVCSPTRSIRRALGAPCAGFLVERWNAKAVAQRFLDLLDGPPPADWVCNPSELRYLFGWGQPEKRSLELVRAIVARGGTKALGLSDKPEAEGPTRPGFRVPRCSDRRLAGMADARSRRPLPRRPPDRPSPGAVTPCPGHPSFGTRGS